MGDTLTVVRDETQAVTASSSLSGSDTFSESTDPTSAQPLSDHGFARWIRNQSNEGSEEFQATAESSQTLTTHHVGLAQGDTYERTAMSFRLQAAESLDYSSETLLTGVALPNPDTLSTTDTDTFTQTAAGQQSTVLDQSCSAGADGVFHLDSLTLDQSAWIAAADTLTGGGSVDSFSAHTSSFDSFTLHQPCGVLCTRDRGHAPLCPDGRTKNYLECFRVELASFA